MQFHVANLTKQFCQHRKELDLTCTSFKMYVMFLTIKGILQFTDNVFLYLFIYVIYVIFILWKTNL